MASYRKWLVPTIPLIPFAVFPLPPSLLLICCFRVMDVASLGFCVPCPGSTARLAQCLERFCVNHTLG